MASSPTCALRLPNVFTAAPTSSRLLLVQGSLALAPFAVCRSSRRRRCWHLLRRDRPLTTFSLPDRNLEERPSAPCAVGAISRGSQPVGGDLLVRVRLLAARRVGPERCELRAQSRRRVACLRAGLRADRRGPGRCGSFPGASNLARHEPGGRLISSCRLLAVSGSLGLSYVLTWISRSENHGGLSAGSRRWCSRTSRSSAFSRRLPSPVPLPTPGCGAWRSSPRGCW